MNIKTLKNDVIKYDNLYNRRFDELRNKIDGQNIIIYGSGEHTEKLISYIGDKNIKCNIIGIADKVESKGKECCGYNVKELKEFLGKYNKIVISSLNFQEIIYERIKNLENNEIEIIKIYKEHDFDQDIERCFLTDDYNLKINQNVYFYDFRTHINRYEFASLVTFDKDVLDIACGIGYGTSLLANNSRSVVGVDIDKVSIEYGLKLFKDENINLNVSSIENFKADNNFDVVISFETIEHIRDEKKYIDKIKEFLKDEGIFIVSTPKSNRDGQSDIYKYHINEYTEKRFVTFLNNNFEVVKLYIQKEENEGYITFREALPMELESHKYTLIAVCKNKLK